MNKRPLDKTKKSNIKCEHCKHYDKEHTKPAWCFNHIEDIPTCDITGEAKHYWNRCKQFEWAERYNEE